MMCFMVTPIEIRQTLSGNLFWTALLGPLHLLADVEPQYQQMQGPNQIQSSA